MVNILRSKGLLVRTDDDRAEAIRATGPMSSWATSPGLATSIREYVAKHPEMFGSSKPARVVP